MSTGRSRRRRRREEPRPIIGRTELITAIVVLAGVGLVLAVILLLSGGGDDDDDDASEATPVPTVTSTPFAPADEDGQAIVELGRRSVEALPQGEWPALYDAFTQEFRDRCALADFIAAGDADAVSLGESLQNIRFRYLIDVVIAGDTVSAVIVGAQVDAEYTIGTAYAREDGEWKIAPAEGTTGCSAFNRLSG